MINTDTKNAYEVEITFKGTAIARVQISESDYVAAIKRVSDCVSFQLSKPVPKTPLLTMD